MRKEWQKVDEAKFEQAFEAMDAELTGPARRFRADRATKVADIPGGALWEVRAPIRGARIYRALCFNPRNWEMYVAFATEKKRQTLPQSWIDKASARVARAQEGGDL